MTVTLPAIYGKADWTDYVDYWRDADVTWLQDRVILRYADQGARDSALGSATAGQPTYVANPDRLEFQSVVGNWIGVLGAQNIEIGPVNNTGGVGSEDESVTISHTASTGSTGLIIGKDITATSTTTTDLNGVLKVVGTGAPGYAWIKTGTKEVKLTTDTTSLVSDSPVTVTGLMQATTITATGALNAATVTATGAVSGGTVVATTTVTAGTALNGTTATIGGVTIGANKVTASDGFYDQQGHFSGTADSAVMSQNNGTVDGASSLEVKNTSIHVLTTGDFTIEGQTKIFESKGLIYYNGASFGVPGSILGYGGPVVYSTTALTASNYPPGTIWVS